MANSPLSDSFQLLTPLFQLFNVKTKRNLVRSQDIAVKILESTKYYFATKCRSLGVKQSDYINCQDLIKLLRTSYRQKAKDMLEIIDLAAQFNNEEEHDDPNNPVKIYTFYNLKIRSVVDDNAKIWFCGKDIGKALEYSDTDDAIRQHVNDNNKSKFNEILKNYPGKMPGKNFNENSIYINQSGLFQLLTRSRLKNKIINKFQTWLYDEILPTLQNTGSYTMWTRQNYDINNFKKKSVVYLIHVKGNLYKFGITDAITKRLDQHKNDYNYSDIVRLWSVQNKTIAESVETDINSQMKHLKLLTKYRGHKELFVTNEENSINDIIAQVESYIEKHNGSISSNETVRFDKLLELEKAKLERDKISLEREKIAVEHNKIKLEIMKEKNKFIQNRAKLGKGLDDFDLSD